MRIFEIAGMTSLLPVQRKDLRKVSFLAAHFTRVVIATYNQVSIDCHIPVRGPNMSSEENKMAEITIYTCDRCGKKREGLHYGWLHLREWFGDYSKLLCEDCKEKLFSFMRKKPYKD
jgi:DNA-directed RNA polymerase subunit RPC12/RpoP